MQPASSLEPLPFPGVWPQDCDDRPAPRDREGQFHTQVFEGYARYEPAVEEGLRQMFVAGVSTRPGYHSHPVYNRTE